MADLGQRIVSWSFTTCGARGRLYHARSATEATPLELFDTNFVRSNQITTVRRGFYLTVWLFLFRLA